ncbi:MAG: 2-phospho-L-lactate transferase [Candidatus Limnocylindria bacterium]
MRVALLAGGTGGTKLAHGFDLVLARGDLAVVANVGDDFDLHGLRVAPDIDALLYTLGGLIDADRGWGVRGDTFSAHELLERYGEPGWFRVGDADLATHVERTRRLRDTSLTDTTAAMAAALGIASRILPASDDRLRTRIVTDAGTLEFQDYFVHLRQEPEVRDVILDGIDSARPTAEVLEAIGAADLVVLGPSNPIVSIGPILALRGVREAIRAVTAPKVAVSPIVAGRALKGPADRMLASLGHESSALGVARMYVGLVDRFVLDEADAALAPDVAALGMVAHVLPAVMRSDDDRAALANALMALR